MIIPAIQFLFEVQNLGFRCFPPRDAQVYCPSEAWLQEFGQYLISIRCPGEKDAWDCDDYALQAVTEASIACHEASLGTGHALVYCTFRVWGPINGMDAPWGSVHACNLVRLDSENYVFFEPQNGKHCDAKTFLDNSIVKPADALL